MKCFYCGHDNATKRNNCKRCNSDLPMPTCTNCGIQVDWNETTCFRCQNLSLEQNKCTSCNIINKISSEYCAECGSPLETKTVVQSIGNKNEQNKTDFSVYGIDTKFIGRGPELRFLINTFRSALENSEPSSLLLCGDYGLGKSRLISEFHNSLDQYFDAAYLILTSCRGSDDPPYTPLADVLRTRFYIPRKDPPEKARQKLESGIRAVTKNKLSTEEIHLVALAVGLKFPDSPHYEEASTENTRNSGQKNIEVEQRTFAACTKLIELDAQNNPMVLVFEDIEKAGTETLALFDYLVSNLQNTPLLVLFTSNSSFLKPHHILIQNPKLTRFELTTLADDETIAILENILRNVETIPSELSRWVCEHAFGNPFTVEEIVRILISEGIVNTQSDIWTVAPELLSRVSLPTSFEGVVKARIETLTDEERDLLEQASVVGTIFWLGALQVLQRINSAGWKQNEKYWLSNNRELRLKEILESLRRKDIIRFHNESQFETELQCTFKHVIERDLIYKYIDLGTRQRYHRMIASWLELKEGPDLALQAESIARHYANGENHKKASFHFIRSGDMARSQYHNRKAIENYQMGLSYLEEDDSLAKIEVLHNLGSVYELLGDQEKAIRCYRKMLTQAWIITNVAKGGVAYNKIGRIYRTLGNYSSALEHFRFSLDLFRQVDDLLGIASNLDDIGKIHWIRGDLEEAKNNYKAGLELRRECGNAKSTALSLNHLGTIELHRGFFKKALIYYREALDLGKEAGDRSGVSESLNNLGIIFYERGEYDHAIHLWKESLTIAKEIGAKVMEGILLNNIGEGLLTIGEIDEASPHLNQSVNILKTCGEKRVLCDALKNLGQVYLANNRYKQATATIKQALALAESLSSKTQIGISLRVLGEVFAQTIFGTSNQQQKRRQAEDCFRRSLEKLREVGNESELGRTLMSYGTFLLEQGMFIQGRKRLEMAKEIFTRLEMKRVLEKTTRTIDEL